METNSNKIIKQIAESFNFPGLKVTVEGSDVTVECVTDYPGCVDNKTATQRVVSARFLVGKAIALALPERKFVRCTYGKFQAFKTGFWHMGYHVTHSVCSGIKEVF